MTARADNSKNLKPFSKGQTGNPNGRPKKLPEIDKLLADVLGSVEDGGSEAQAVLVALLDKAKKGDVRACEIILDRAYGKAKQTVDINASGADEIIIAKKKA